MSRPLVVGWCGPSDGPWGWIQRQFTSIQVLDDSDIADWLTPTPSTLQITDRMLLFARENRCDIQALATGTSPASISKTKRKVSVPIALLMGNDWHGHRRTYPTPEGIPSFYWYQWYDRIFPWVSEIRSPEMGGDPASATKKSASDRSKSSTASNDSMAWRVRWMLDRSRWQASMLRSSQIDTLCDRNRLAWILTDHADQRELWRDACREVGLQVVASHLRSDPPWFEPDLIVVDCVSRSDESDRAIESAIHTARERHPQAHLALVSPFPTWDRWLAWQNIGVDAILPRPATLQGFLVYWRVWRSQTEA
jgi:hypothetical protein